MYKIIGADQKEYGPVSYEELKVWISQGRANAQSQVLKDTASEWRPLGSLAEFAGLFSAPTTPPPFQPLSAPCVYPQRTSGLAVAGVIFSILGLVGFCCCGPLFSTLGLVFSWIALVQINDDPNRRGREMAIAGIILAILGLLLFVGLVSFGFLRKAPTRFHFRVP